MLFFPPAFLICRLFGLLGVCCDRKMLAAPRFIHRSPQMFFYVWMWVTFYFFFFPVENLQLITILQTGQKWSEKKGIKKKSKLFRGCVKQYRTSSFELQSWNVSHLAVGQSFVVHSEGNDPPFPVAAHKKCRKCQHIYLCLVHAPLSRAKDKSTFECFQFHLVQFSIH